MIKAIETRYRGYRFRSRLEARWAVFFDALGVKWEYEIEGFETEAGRYLPDFWLPYVYDRVGQKGVWIEIKGQAPTPEENKKCDALVAMTKHSVNLFFGLPDQNYYVDPSNDSGYQWTYASPESYWDNNMGFHYCTNCRAVKIEFRNDYYECFNCRKNSCTDDNATIDHAYKAARSARFEHGE